MSVLFQYLPRLDSEKNGVSTVTRPPNTATGESILTIGFIPRLLYERILSCEGNTLTGMRHHVRNFSCVTQPEQSGATTPSHDMNKFFLTVLENLHIFVSVIINNGEE